MVLENLDNNEQILLMYLAGELPAADHQEVEQMLLSDNSLRRELHRLEAVQQDLAGGLDQLDKVSPLPARSEVLARNISRQWQQALARPRTSEKTPGLAAAGGSWRWFFPTAMAAGVAIVAMLWLGQQADLQRLQAQQAYNKPVRPIAGLKSQPEAVASASDVEGESQLLIRSLQAPAEADPMDLGSDSSGAKPPADADAKTAGAAGGDAMPQDELSRYLWSTASLQP